MAEIEKPKADSSENWGCVGTVLLFAAVLGFQDYRNYTKVKQLQAEVVQLKRKVAEMPQNGTLDQQAKCSRQADLVLKEGDWKPEDSAVNTNHYDPKRNRCFVEIDAMILPKAVRDQQTIIKLLSDAFEGKVYGTYNWISRDDKKYWEVKPMECWVISKDGKRQQCKSDGEFDELAKQYLQ